MPNGFIQENLDRTWKPWGDQRVASLNGQGRQLFSMAIGCEMSHHDKSYLGAVTKGADFLMKMHDDQYGGYYNRTTPDLKVIDDTKTGSTSFVIYSLATAARVTGNQKYADTAMAAFREVRDKMRDGPFFQGNMNREFTGPSTRGGGGGRGQEGAACASGPGAAAGRGGHSLNVHMFEALLGLYDATGSKEVWAEISAELDAMAKLYDYNNGYLPEGYDKDWKPAGGPGGGTGQVRANTGHLFESASLLSRAVELGADPKFVELGSRSIDLGIKNGYNDAVGGLGGATPTAVRPQRCGGRSARC
jgi:mannose/cellobiose epimerase-like protein (N-acyl-D-glucosamine 2-epimerase family)